MQGGNEMVEFHVDTCHVFEVKVNSKTELGDWLSVRNEEYEKPLIMIGHDD